MQQLKIGSAGNQIKKQAGMKPTGELRTNFRPISSCFRLNNSKNFLAISRAGFGRLAGGDVRQGGTAKQGAGTALRDLIRSNGAVDVARRMAGV
jgi:hypothetical protein